MISDHPDDDVLARLGTLARRTDRVPPSVVAAAQGAFAWRTLSGDIAKLVYDSATDEGLVGVRGGGRQLSFEGRDLVVEIEAIAGERRVVGQVLPGGRGLAEVRSPGGAVLAPIDELGRFSTDRVAAGPVSIRCSVETAGGEVVTETEWVLL